MNQANDNEWSQPVRVVHHSPGELYHPSVAEAVADQIRTRILNGAIGSDGALPKQEELLAELRVSKQSLREALRLLEAEGLVRVRRGAVGGSEIRIPDAAQAARTLGLVLESQSVGLDDLAAALNHLEPMCAALCAEREDRLTTLVPKLRQIHQRSVEAVDNEVGITRHARHFHEELVASCGNATMTLVVGALESLWSTQEHAWAARVASNGGFPGRELRDGALRAHEELIELIADGDVDATLRLAREHLEGRLYPPRGAQPGRGPSVFPL